MDRLLTSLLILIAAGQVARAQADPTAPTLHAKPIASFAMDSREGWGDCSLPEDKPMSVEPTRAPGDVHEGAGAVRLTFDADVGPVGMKYFQVSGIGDSDGYSFWVKGDGSGATLQVRLSQRDWSAWDSPVVRLDWTGWRRVVVLRDDCLFHNWGKQGRRWSEVRVFAVRLSGKSCSVVVDDLQFHRDTAKLPRQAIAARGPITLTIDAGSTLPPIPIMLKGVDLALVNWGANKRDLNFGMRTQKQLKDSGAKLVRFWTFCPPLGVSPGADRYDWSRFDRQMERIKAAGAETIMTCCFTPRWLSADGTKEGLPSDWAAYEKLIADTVRHCRDKGWPVRYWEAWNEPDLAGGGFLKADRDQFLQLYSHFVRAVRSVDPNARVGGPAAAGANMDWLGALIDHAAAENLPLDFVSWHVYDLMPDGMAASARAVRSLLDEHPQFKETQLIIDEWNCTGGPDNAYDTEYAAAFQAAALHRMLDVGVDASVFFAFVESAHRTGGKEFGGSWGMITHTGVPKPSYHSFRIFAELTGPRRKVTGGDDEVNAIATRTDEALVLMLYRFQPDRHATDRPVHLKLTNWPGDAPLAVTVELVDDTHANPLHDRDNHALQTVKTWAAITPGDLQDLAITLRPQAVARVTIRSASGATALPQHGESGDDR